MFLKVVGFQQKEKKKISFSILGDMTTKNNTKSRFFDQITSFWQKILFRQCLNYTQTLAISETQIFEVK